jgi:bifunctional non-homologous end joining protein LigD
MGLDEYNKKRKFNKTPEPTGGDASGNKLHFVVQKHAASHLHYDFRLEVRGVLKSWAVPKGPSMKGEDKRLAMETEDHPYDYKDFEGIIPKGQYGGGTVIIWDEGTFDTPDAKKDKKSQEHELTSQYYKGEMLFTLHGHKLKGKFALIRDRSKGDNSWYLIKVKDTHVLKTDITKKDKSVVSGLTIEQMKNNTDAREWQSNRGNDTSGDDKRAPSSIKQGKEAPMPAKPEAMNATLIKKPFNDPAWTYELKLDGYRILAVKKGDNVWLNTRGGLNYTKYYPIVADAIKELDHDCVLDGELVVLDEKGRPNFDLLQKYKGNNPIAYYCFDILWLDGYDVTGLELTERKSILLDLLPEEHPVIKYSDDFEDGEQLFEMVSKMELEGIVAKERAAFTSQAKEVKIG